MGTVPNVGLMAQAAEEYGSHNKTFADSRQRHRPRRRRDRQGAPRARRRRRRHLARLPDQGRAGAGLGEARRQPRPPQQHARRLLARREARARRADHRQGEDVPRRSTTPTGLDIRILAARRGLPRSRSSASRPARTRSPSPATCCATISPTSSRSSKSARARRCSRSFR